MAVVKANYVKRGKGERGRAKATIRYIQHRRDRDGERVSRTLFGFDGELTREQAYRMIDEAQKGTIFYRFVLSPDPKREDRYKTLICPRSPFTPCLPWKSGLADKSNSVPQSTQTTAPTAMYTYSLLLEAGG
jgi:hypothetical protein